MVGVALGADSDSGGAVKTDSVAGAGVGSISGVATGMAVVSGSDSTPVPGGSVGSSSKIGAPVVGLLVGFVDGPSVHVGDDDMDLSSSILEVISDGAGEGVGGSIGGRVVGPLVGTLDG